jgi:hypothetical protein
MGKLVPVHDMKSHREVRAIATLILNLGIRWR